MEGVNGGKDSGTLLGAYIRQSPRAAGALAFGGLTLVVQHFVWYPDARMRGLAPVLTIAVALCHAIFGAMTGPRLVDGARTSTPSRAAMLGAITSLLALLLFAFLFSAYLVATDIHPVGALSYVTLPIWAVLFAFLGDGWALCLVSIGIGLALYFVAARRRMARGQRA
ncbi:MAG TPA: hypothetical protein VFZ27_16015 [Terriglobia bacterium]|nr:hypothetical protein [Terriglobia bacterium]